ncbi:hypothetical protein K501DRAFT_284457 [Backusella circina FSU 941]|nr:hypothetical protein K501DRAFT_284457 [Backusella circina FSU 941]
MAEDSSKKNNKKFAVGGELPPSPTTSTSKTKRPTRHHVKRRSSGRVHVTKLAPMARAAEDEDKKSIKRSHSQKSLHRLPSNDKRHTVSGFTTATTEDASPHSPPSTPPPPQSTIAKRKPSFTVSSTSSPAAPVELPLSVTAYNIASPDTPIFDMKKPLLKSQFINNNNNSSEQIRNDDMLQHSQQHEAEAVEETEEEEMTQVDQWLQKLTQEYQCVKQHRDPMRESIIRCQQRQQQQKNHRPNTHQRTVSYSVLEEKKYHSPYEQRRQILLKTALQRQHQEQEARNNRWTTGTFLDRLLYG